MIYIDKYAYISGLKDANPLMKILFGGLSLVVCVCSWSVAAFVVVFCTMSYFILVKAGISRGYYFKLLLLPLGFLLLGVAGVIVNISRTLPETGILFTWNIGGYCVYVSETGILLGGHLVCKSLAAVSCLYFIILTTPFRDLVYFLRWTKCPGRLIDLSALIYRFIFLLLDIAEIKLKSQRCRGGFSGARGFSRNFARLWGSVFVQAWLKNERFFQSMRARGYDGRLRFPSKTSRLDGKEIVLLTSFLLVTAACNFIPLIGRTFHA